MTSAKVARRMNSVYPTDDQLSRADLPQLLRWWQELPIATTPEETRIKTRLYDLMQIGCGKLDREYKAKWERVREDERKRKREVA